MPTWLKCPSAKAGSVSRKTCFNQQTVNLCSKWDHTDGCLCNAHKWLSSYSANSPWAAVVFIDICFEENSVILTCATSDTTRVDKFKRRCVWIKQNLSDKVYFKDQPAKDNVQLPSCLTVIVVKYVLSLQLLYFEFNGHIHLRVLPPECTKNTSYRSQPKLPISVQCMLKLNRIDQFKKF